MKKFLIFLVAIITTVCIGVTFYQFARNDEVIKVTKQTVYLNYGDKLSLEDLGFSRTDASKDTKIDFNAGGSEVTSIIKYDEVTQCYIPTSKGGATTIKISTTNRKYKSLSVDVVVGIGTEENPYYITTENQLFSIGNVYSLDSCYKLINDIDISKSHKPIGLIDGKYNEFNGSFDGNFKTISGLKIDSCDFGGLFAIMGSNSSVYNLNIDAPIISGSYINVGSVAGICYGTINKVIVSNASIINNHSSSYTGAIVGLLQYDAINYSSAKLLRSAAYSDTDVSIKASGVLGGLVGMVNNSSVHACYSNIKLNNTSNNFTGGLIGELIVGTDAYVRESYSVSSINTKGVAGNLVGRTSLSQGTNINSLDKEMVLIGLYYDNTINSLKGVGVDTCEFASASSFAVTGKSSYYMKRKSTYIYYVTKDNTIVYWDKVWDLVDGELPALTFISKFDEVILDKDETNTKPETPGTSNPEKPDITNPEKPTNNVVVLSTRQDLINHFQTGKNVTGNYVLNANISLEDFEWTPVKFSGSFKSNKGHNYSISNFQIKNSGYYNGFFYSLSNANIESVTFKNITITSNASESTGALVGYIAGNTTIKNVKIDKATISAGKSNTKYAGGLVGYAGNSIVNIENSSVTNTTIDGISNVGGLAGYVADNTLINSCQLTNTTLSGIDRVGGITGVNHGSINNCRFNGKISSTSNATHAGYFGGCTGVNYGSISSVTISALTNITSNSTDIYYFAGGLCGYNLGSITKSVAFGSEYSSKTSTGLVCIAGLTGFNSGDITNCRSHIDTIGTSRKNCYTAGLSVYNYGGKITGCLVWSDLNGYEVAGLVHTNTDDGIVDGCMVGENLTTRALFSGVQLASFVYDMSSGTISNCLVNAQLNCTASNGWVAGFAAFMACNQDKFGTISTSIANVEFKGNGYKYLELAQDGLMKKDRTAGTIKHCVISSDAYVEGVMVSEYSKTLFGKVIKPGSGSNFVIADNNKITNISTYLDVDNCNFSISYDGNNAKWKYNNSIPYPSDIISTLNLVDG